MTDDPSFDRGRVVSYLESSIVDAENDRDMGAALVRDSEARLVDLRDRLAKIKALP